MLPARALVASALASLLATQVGWPVVDAAVARAPRGPAGMVGVLATYVLARALVAATAGAVAGEGPKASKASRA